MLLDKYLVVRLCRLVACKCKLKNLDRNCARRANSRRKFALRASNIAFSLLEQLLSAHSTTKQARSKISSKTSPSPAGTGSKSVGMSQPRSRKGAMSVITRLSWGSLLKVDCGRQRGQLGGVGMHSHRIGSDGEQHVLWMLTPAGLPPNWQLAWENTNQPLNRIRSCQY